MLIVDAHLDLAWNALQWNRNLHQSVYTIRTGEAHMPGKGRGLNTVSFPQMREGRIGLCITTLLARNTGTPVEGLDYGSWEQAYSSARGQLAYYDALEQTGQLRMIDTVGELDAHWAEWERYDATTGAAVPILGAVLSMEGADPIRTPDDLKSWWDVGLRLLGITHYGPGRYAGGTNCEAGLATGAIELLKAMDELGMPQDMTHCSDDAFWEALDHFNGRVLASHNNCRELAPHQRQFDDAQLRAIFERDGVIGLALDAWMIQAGFIKDVSTTEGITLAKAADHVDYICQLAGNCRHAAIGSDLDGGFGLEQGPCDLNTIADLQCFVDILNSRGYKTNDIAAIMHGNWIRFLRETLPKG